MRYSKTTPSVLRAALAGCFFVISLAGCGGSAAPTQVAPAATVSAPTNQPPASASPSPAGGGQAGNPAPGDSAPAGGQPAPSENQPAASPEATYAAAVEAVADYYAALNDKRYQEAYAFWADGGAASQQTFEQFQGGFANTAGIKLDIGPRATAAVDQTAGSVAVPVSVVAITNDADGQQSVHQYAGTYTIAQRQGAWSIIGANISEKPSPSLPAPEFSDPAQVIQSYYQAINARDFGRAFTHWNNNGAASQQTFEQFAAGFADTGSVAVSLGAVAANAGAGSAFADVPVVIFVTNAQGGLQTFCGTYSLRKANVPPFDQFGWRLDRAAIAPTAAVAPDSPEAQQLLNGGCR